ncbi:hypothetical protein BSIN_2103 [Burkholderia singularis]|uniref:Uncharacterized protein n=1 Tax=Burkholderia singularis TaxID=1503053 RepID=A0A238H0S7_9BURK|nr:hypothetical protein BSIN_2103 [Burkholderia singularis]
MRSRHAERRRDAINAVRQKKWRGAFDRRARLGDSRIAGRE